MNGSYRKREPVSAATIDAFERSNNITFPADYRRFLLETDACEFEGPVVFNDDGASATLSVIGTLGDAIRTFDALRSDVGQPAVRLPRYLFPLTYDDFDNVLFLSLATLTSGHVYRIRWGMDDFPDDAGDPDIENLAYLNQLECGFKLANSFTEFFDGLQVWTEECKPHFEIRPRQKREKPTWQTEYGIPGQRPSPERLSEVESQLGVDLPTEYRDFLLHTTKAEPELFEVTFAHDPNPTHASRKSLCFFLPIVDALPHDFGCTSAIELAAHLRHVCNLPRTLLPIAQGSRSWDTFISLSAPTRGHIYCIPWHAIRLHPPLWNLAENHDPVDENPALMEYLERQHKVCDSFDELLRALGIKRTY